jgi:transcriptional regulator of aromatic amino acid metabolism
MLLQIRLPAQGGTLFLDEIGNLPMAFQARLLRVLQERRMVRVGGRKTIELDVRLVSATNVNVKEAVQKGRSRQDLFFRLQEVAINLPPLRERPGDVTLLTEYHKDIAMRRIVRYPFSQITGAVSPATGMNSWDAVRSAATPDGGPAAAAEKVSQLPAVAAIRAPQAGLRRLGASLANPQVTAT